MQTLAFQPAQLANGAVELLNEVAGSKITGEEDRYSHTDLADFEANVAGAQKAFELLRPALIERKDGALVKTLNARFADVQKGLPPVPPRYPARLRAVRRADPQGPQDARPGDRRPGRAALDGRVEGDRLTVSRRRLLEATGGGALGLLIAGGGYAVGHATGSSSSSDDAASQVVPFYGVHQAGITTPAQDRLAFASFDLTLTSKPRAARPAAHLERRGREAVDRRQAGTRAGAAAAASRRHG